MNKSLLTIFTPSYNRKKLLPRLYNSLQNQTKFNFEWIIVDDGSADGTENLVYEWIKKEENFKIRYFYKENGGLHTGYNVAIENCDTELCMCVDSDDWLPNDAAEKIEKIWNSIDKNKYIGIIGLDYFEDGQISGDRLPEKSDYIYFYNKELQKIKGDKKFIHKTDILKKIFPQKSFNKEKNFNPNYSFYKANKYGPLYPVNECFCIVEYQADGMTSNMFLQYYNSPRSFAEIRKLYMTLPNADINFLFRTNIHYVSSCCIAKRLKYAIKESPKKVFTIMAFPFGLLFAVYIKYKVRKKQNGKN